MPSDHTSDADNLLVTFNPFPDTVTMKDFFSPEDLKESVPGFTLTLISESATSTLATYVELPGPTFVTVLGNKTVNFFTAFTLACIEG